MKNTLRRIVSALLIIPLLLAFSIPASAYGIFEDSKEEEEKQQEKIEQKMDRMGNEIFKWYKLIRYCAVFFMIISLASAGFKFVSRGFTQSMKYSTDDVIMQVIVSIVAFAVLMFIPHIIGAAKDFLMASAWDPDGYGSFEERMKKLKEFLDGVRDIFD